jgi:hypothetical protein
MAEHGLAEEADAIQGSQGQLLSYNSTIRRGRVVRALQHANLLDEFVRCEWPNGLTDKGRSEIQRCISVYQRFLGESPPGENPSARRRRNASTPTTQTRRNPFVVLGIAPNAEGEVIAASYRALARKYHPDVNWNLTSNGALARMRELTGQKTNWSEI